MRAPKSVSVGLSLPFLQVNGTWEPNDAERHAAWELYIELITRVAVVPLEPGHGLLREALDSLYTLAATTRDVLRRHGPAVAEPKKDGQYNFGYLAVAILNLALRPLLAEWHPGLAQWETGRPLDVSRAEHEHAWPREPELRAALDHTRDILTNYANLLAQACGVPNLLDAVPRPSAEEIKSSHPHRA